MLVMLHILMTKYLLIKYRHYVCSYKKFPSVNSGKKTYKLTKCTAIQKRCTSYTRGDQKATIHGGYLLFGYLYWKRKLLTDTLNNGLFHTDTCTVLPQYNGHRTYMSCFYEILTL